ASQPGRVGGNATDAASVRDTESWNVYQRASGWGSARARTAARARATACARGSPRASYRAATQVAAAWAVTGRLGANTEGTPLWSSSPARSSPVHTESTARETPSPPAPWATVDPARSPMAN